MIGILASYCRALRLGSNPRLGIRARTLALLESRPGERLTRKEIGEAIGAELRALSNCLVRMRQLGLVRVEGEGKGRVYWVPR